SPGQMLDFSRAPNPSPATLVNVPLIGVRGIAHAQMANTAATKVTFDQEQITSRARKTVNTTSYTSSLTSSLLRDLQLDVSPLGSIPTTGIARSVADLLSARTTAIDTALSTTFTALGVGLGQVDVWVPGVRCDGAVLVN